MTYKQINICLCVSFLLFHYVIEVENGMIARPHTGTGSKDIAPLALGYDGCPDGYEGKITIHNANHGLFRTWGHQ